MERLHAWFSFDYWYVYNVHCIIESKTIVIEGGLGVIPMKIVLLFSLKQCAILGSSNGYIHVCLDVMPQEGGLPIKTYCELDIWFPFKKIKIENVLRDIRGQKSQKSWQVLFLLDNFNGKSLKIKHSYEEQALRIVSAVR